MLRVLCLLLLAVMSALSRTVPAGECVSDCSGVPDGDYQACARCEVYVSCHQGTFYGNRPCPPGLVWDDDEKKCDYDSRTCNDCTEANCCMDQRGKLRKVSDWWFVDNCETLYACRGNAAGGPYIYHHYFECDSCQYQQGIPTCVKFDKKQQGYVFWFLFMH